MCINLNSPTLVSERRVSLLPEYSKPTIDFSSLAMTTCLSFMSVVQMIKYSDDKPINGERVGFVLLCFVLAYNSR